MVRIKFLILLTLVFSQQNSAASLPDEQILYFNNTDQSNYDMYYFNTVMEDSEGNDVYFEVNLTRDGDVLFNYFSNERMYHRTRDYADIEEHNLKKTIRFDSSTYEVHFNDNYGLEMYINDGGIKISLEWIQIKGMLPYDSIGLVKWDNVQHSYYVSPRCSVIGELINDAGSSIISGMGYWEKSWGNTDQAPTLWINVFSDRSDYIIQTTMIQNSYIEEYALSDTKSGLSVSTYYSISLAPLSYIEDDTLIHGFGWKIRCNESGRDFIVKPLFYDNALNNSGIGVPCSIWVYSKEQSEAEKGVGWLVSTGLFGAYEKSFVPESIYKNTMDYLNSQIELFVNSKKQIRNIE